MNKFLYKTAGAAERIYLDNIKRDRSGYLDPLATSKHASLKYWDKLTNALGKWMGRASNPAERAAREARYVRAMEFRDSVDNSIMGEGRMLRGANITTRIPKVRELHNNWKTLAPEQAAKNWENTKMHWRNYENKKNGVN